MNFDTEVYNNNLVQTPFITTIKSTCLFKTAPIMSQRDSIRFVLFIGVPLISETSVTP